MRDITITREFPIINDYAIMPDYGPGKIPLHTAMALPGITFDYLTNVTRASAIRRSQAFLKTRPGLTECCDNPPADQITEIVKTRVPSDPPYPEPEPQPGPCVQHCDCSTLRVTFDLPTEGACGCMRIKGPLDVTVYADPDDPCFWFGTAYDGEFTVEIGTDILCETYLIIRCDQPYQEGGGSVIIWAGVSYSNDPLGPYEWIAGCPEAHLMPVVVACVGPPV